MWPRLLANKILKNRLLGSNNFVADFPSDSESTTSSMRENTITTTIPSSCDFAQPTLSFDTIFNPKKDVHKYKYVNVLVPFSTV